jgi:hypothetical protein
MVRSTLTIVSMLVIARRERRCSSYGEILRLSSLDKCVSCEAVTYRDLLLLLLAAFLTPECFITIAGRSSAS